MFRRAVPLLAATVLVACGGGNDPAATPVSPTSVVAEPPTGAPAPGGVSASDVPAALQLTAPLVGGGEIELDAYAGRPVLLWFWAPW